MPLKRNDPLTRKSIRSALRAWDSPQRLGRHPLARLSIVDARRRTSGYPDTPSGYGLALRDVLAVALDQLRPDEGKPDYTDKRWRSFLIIHGQYLDGRTPGYLTEQLGIARSTYNHEQAAALDMVTEILQQWEQSHGVVKPATTSVIPRVTGFCGREQELADYLDQLENQHVAVIIGMPGIGKTALGAEIASRLQAEGRDVFWMSFGKGINSDIDSLFREIAVFLAELGREEFWDFLALEGEAEQQYPLHTKIQRLIRVLEEGDFTLCFDNYEVANTDQDITTFFEVLRDRAVHGQTIRLLVMSQEKPAFAADMEIQPLEGLPREQAQEVLAEAGLPQLPKALFEKLYETTRGHPILLHLFSAWVVKSGLAGFATRGGIQQVEQFIEGMAQATDIETYLLVNVYNALNAEEQHLAELMSAFRLPFDDRDEAIIEIFVEEGISNPALVLAGLTRKHIVNRVGGSGYVEFPPLLRQYFYNRLRGQLTLKRRLHGRIGEYYEHFKEDYLEAAYHYREAAEYVRAVTLLDRYQQQLIGAGKAQRMLEILTPLRKHQVPASTWPWAAAMQGQAYAFLGEYEEALARFEETLAEFEGLPLADESRRRVADLARQIGRLYGWRGEYEKANARMEQALQILGEIKTDEDRIAAALIHAHTGSLYFLQGHLQQAEQQCHQALELLGPEDESAAAATAYNVLGVLCQVTGRWDEAVDHYNRSRQIWAKLGDRHHLAQVTDNLGGLYLYRGDLALAEKLSKESLEFWHEVGARDNAGYARCNLGAVQLLRGQWEPAREHFTQALVIWQQTGNQKLISLALNNLGFLEIARGRFKEAQEYLLKSIAADPNVLNYEGLGEAELGLGHLEQALENVQKSLQLARESGMLYEEGIGLRTLGRIYQALGDVDQARSHLETSLAILTRLGAQYEMAYTRYYLALLEAETGQLDVARGYLSEAMTVFEKIGARENLVRAREWIAALLMETCQKS